MNEVEATLRTEIFTICDAYESGYGHGLKQDGLDLSKTPHARPGHGMAYQFGYDAGVSAALSAQEEAP